MYDTNAQAVGDKLKAASSTVFTQDTIDSILSLVSTPNDGKIVVDTIEVTANGTITPPAGAEVVFVTLSETQQTKVSLAGNAPAVFFQGAGGVDATIGGAAPNVLGQQSAALANADAIQRVIVGTAGADKITIADGRNTQVVAGDKDVIVAGDGHTVVIAAQGSSTVIGGDDTIVQAKGGDEDFSISLAADHARITNAQTGVSVDLVGVQYVQLDNSEALIFAANAKQAAVANLYQAVFGRTADAGGLDFWFEQADKGMSVKAIAQGFLSSSEYQGAGQSNAQFVDALYHGLMGRNADASGAQFWVDALGHGVSRADVVAAFAEAAVNGSAEVSVVGTVTVVPGLV